MFETINARAIQITALTGIWHSSTDMFKYKIICPGLTWARKTTKFGEISL